MSRSSRLGLCRSILVLVLFVGAACGSSDPSEGPTSSPASPDAPAEEDPLEGVWSTGPVPIEDIRAAMLAAGLDVEAVEGWIDLQQAPLEMAFGLQFDPPDFAHSRADAYFPLQVDESGTYEFADGELRLSFPDLGDAYVFEATLSDDTLSLELVDQRETGTAEDAETHRMYTVALYASTQFFRQP